MKEEEKSIRVGVEEEFHIVDVGTRRLAARADLLLEALPEASFAQELQRSTVESNSRPWTRLEELARDLCELRGRLIRQADEVGLGISAAGSSPLVEMAEVKVSPEPRYEQMLNDYQQLTREQLICGTHVHAEVPDPDVAVAVAHRLTPWLPPLLALSASSPYWDGEDTGYASFRSLVWQRWPTAGPIAKYESAAEYEEMIKELIRSGVITDPGMLYFDIRPSQHVPTVELRICDSCPRVQEIVLIAGVFRALVARELEAVRQGVERDVHLEAVRAATWQAARSGLEGELIDPVGGLPRPAPVVVRRMLEGLRPQLEEAGDWELVSELAEEVLATGSSAQRQRRAFARRGRLADVVDLLLHETRACEWDRPAGDPPAYRSAS
ncbi:carboxylate-amine ligase [[Actinomadura] parvosata]|uniref:carboxylate-amine ligase n=1 Tax=[Actinomadura] parvosata TaxID=1955412 RepID=UPI00406CF4B2